MRHRTNYYVYASRGEDAIPSAILRSCNDHPDVNIKDILKRISAEETCIHEVVCRLLNERYPSDHPAHRKGDPIFSLDSEPYDHEESVLIYRSDDGSIVFDVEITHRNDEAAPKPPSA